MINNLKDNRTLFWVLAIVSLPFTGLPAFITMYEYVNVGVLKNVKGYPFGHEGPVAGIEYYKSAELYAAHMLKTGLFLLALFALNLYLIIKRSTRGLVVLMSIALAWTLYCLVQEKIPS